IAALDLLYYIRYGDSGKSFKAIVKIPNLLSSALKLCIYKLNQKIDQKEEQEVDDIRKWAIHCLMNYHYQGDASIHKQLAQQGFSQAFIKMGCSAGGCYDAQKKIMIQDSLFYNDSFFAILNNGRTRYSPYFPPQRITAKFSEEQIEEEGGNEEIVANFINKDSISYYQENLAQQIQISILNCFIHKSNLDYDDEDGENEDEENMDYDDDSEDEDQEDLEDSE
ncbi:MAG: hypothetical protein EZS28_046842, partial [Streblomastix strix]